MYMYIYKYTYICIYICVYIHIYIEREIETISVCLYSLQNGQALSVQGPSLGGNACDPAGLLSSSMPVFRGD